MISCFTLSLQCIFLLLIVTGLSTLVYIDPVIDYFIKNNVNLKAGSDFFKSWHEFKLPIRADITLFNVTNSLALDSGEESIVRVSPVGPFTFQIKRRNTIIYSNDSVIEYEPKTYFYYDENIPGNTPMKDRKITIPNVPLMAVISKIRSKKYYFFREMVGFLTSELGATTFTQKLPSEVMFDGYADSIFKMARIRQFFAKEAPLPKLFSFLGPKNDSNIDGNWTIMTGVEDGNDVLKLVAWNRQSRLPFKFKEYKTKTSSSQSCNTLRGGDGMKFRSPVSENHVLYMFLPGDICTSMPFAFDSYSTVGSLKTFRFKMRYDESNRYLSCYSPEGYLDIGACFSDAPVFASAPHFYGSSPSLVQGIKGLNPNRTLHESVIDVEPMTGFLLRIAMRLQINVNVTRQQSFPTSRLRFQGRLIPVFALDSSAEADKESLDLLYKNVFEKIQCLKFIAWLSSLLGMIGTLILHRSLLRRISDIKTLVHRE